MANTDQSKFPLTIRRLPGRKNLALCAEVDDLTIPVAWFKSDLHAITVAATTGVVTVEAGVLPRLAAARDAAEESHA